MERKVFGNCVLIGDSSGGEPLMGSSLHKSMDEARMAAGLLIKGRGMDGYEELWGRRFSEEFKFEDIARGRLEGMQDERIDNFFRGKVEVSGGGLVTGLLKDLIKA